MPNGPGRGPELGCYGQRISNRVGEGCLATTRTGLAPAGDDQVMIAGRPPPDALGARKSGLAGEDISAGNGGGAARGGQRGTVVNVPGPPAVELDTGDATER